jgi:hypothetical protein
MSKQHHFIVVGVEDAGGDISFTIDGDVPAFPDGPIFDAKTQTWERITDDNEERDDRIFSELSLRLERPA